MDLWQKNGQHRCLKISINLDGLVHLITFSFSFGLLFRSAYANVF